MFKFKIKKISNGNVVVDTTSTTRMENLTPSQQIEYLEVESQLYGLERQRKREEKALAKRAAKENTMISYVAGLVSAGMTVLGVVTFNPWLFVTGIGCACLSTNLSVSLVGIGNCFSKANEAFENYMKIKFPKFWEFLNS